MFLVSLLFLLFFSSCSNGQTTLRFGFISTITGGVVANGAIPAVDMAISQVNNHTGILQNYTLERTQVYDSNCDRTVTLDSFFKIVDTRQPPIVTLLGCGCSLATIVVAEISHYWNIPQLAFAAAANDLNDRTRFRNFFRSLPTLEYVAASLVQLMRNFGWRQIAVITQNENLFKGTTDSLKSIGESEGRIVDTSIYVETSANPFPYNSVFDSLVAREQHRIIFINTYPDFAYHILCEAYRRGMYSPNYVWILHMWYNEEWWINHAPTDATARTCTPSQIRSVINGSIGVIPDGYLIMNNQSIKTFSGLNAQEFNEQYFRLFQREEYRNYTPFSLVGLAYDGAWAIAIGLDIATRRIAAGNDSGCEELPGDLVPLEYFNYTNEKLGCIMRQSMHQVQFLGLTGHISFNINGSRPNTILIAKQYRLTGGSLLRQSIGTVVVDERGNTSFSFLAGESNSKLWTDGQPPYDGYAEDVTHQNDIILVIIYAILSFCGLVLAIFFFIFNILCRHKKVIKLTSPNLNYLIILGAILLYLCVIFYTYSPNSGKTQTVLCNVRVWLFSLGYNLCFAVILSKTWRIYYIFNRPKLQKKKTIIKDYVLLIMIAIIVTIDLVIILLGTVIPQSRLVSSRIRDIEHPQTITDEGRIQENSIYVCARTNSIIWLSLSFGYKGFLQVVAIFMAFHTRRVKVKVLNESIEITAIIYINSIILVLLVVTEFTLVKYHNAYAALFGLALIVDASLFLCLVFIPKMINLYLDPEGKKIFTHETDNMNNTNGLHAHASAIQTSTPDK